MSNTPHRPDKWYAREQEKRWIEEACDWLDRQSDYLADTTPFGQALRNYVDGIVGHALHWRRWP